MLRVYVPDVMASIVERCGSLEGRLVFAAFSIQLSALSRAVAGGRLKDFRKLLVWEKAHALTLDIYRVTDTFPRREMFGVTSQLRRASASIAANIAEACGRVAKGDFSRFLSNAMGSASEVEYFLVLCRDLKLIAPGAYATCNNNTVEVKRMLAALITKVEMERRAN